MSRTILRPYPFIPWLSLLVIVTGCASTPKDDASVKSTPPSQFMGGQNPQAFSGTFMRKVRCKYLIFLPQGYGNEPKLWPLILFLHGSGERGNDPELIKRHGPPKLVEKRKDLPFIVVSPQCPEDDWWSNDVLITLLDEVISKYSIDPDRVYLTGLSMGGFGTWSLAIEYPDRFAAIAPLSGEGNPLMAFRLKNVPVWVFHGAKDAVVPPDRAQAMVNALEKCGANVKFTLYPDLAHNCWTKTYETPELYRWFLEQTRK